MGKQVSDSERDDPRRDFLIRAMKIGLFTGGLGWNSAMAQWFGGSPNKLPKGKSVFEIKGTVKINGKKADRDTIISAKDTIETDNNSYLIAGVGATAVIVRENSKLALEGNGIVIENMRLVTGAMLTVFGSRKSAPVTVRTPTATIGIRGTGLYAEVDPDRTYLCTCYGTTDLASVQNPTEQESVTTTHHDKPRYILATPEGGRHIIPAPFINHTDLELQTIEAIVGRTVPFGIPDDGYSGSRRDY